MVWQWIQEWWRHFGQICEIIWEYSFTFGSDSRGFQNCKWILACHWACDRRPWWAWFRFLRPDPTSCMRPWSCIVDFSLILVDLWQDHSVHSELFNIVHVLSNVVERRHFWRWNPRINRFKHNLRTIILAQIRHDIVAVFEICPDLLDCFYFSFDLAGWA